MNPLVLTTGILCFVLQLDGAEIVTKRYYQIKSFEGALLTVGGDNSAGIKIVTEDTRGTDPRQAFLVEEGVESHLLRPQNQNSWSSLVLDMETSDKYLVTQKVHIYLTHHQWWRIQDVGNSKWFVQNYETGLCMASAGKSVQTFGKICDRTDANQTWEFIPVSRSVRILDSE